MYLPLGFLFVLLIAVTVTLGREVGEQDAVVPPLVVSTATPTPTPTTGQDVP